VAPIRRCPVLALPGHHKFEIFGFGYHTLYEHTCLEWTHDSIVDKERIWLCIQANVSNIYADCSTKGDNAICSWVYKGFLVLLMIVFRDSYVSLTLYIVKLVRLSEN
jgi:hypothetical protein